MFIYSFPVFAGFLFTAFVIMMFIVVIFRMMAEKSDLLFLLPIADVIETASLLTGWPFVFLGIKSVSIYFEGKRRKF